MADRKYPNGKIKNTMEIWDRTTYRVADYGFGHCDIYDYK